MRRTVLFLIAALLCVANARSQEITLTVTAAEKEQVALDLERAAKSGDHNAKTSELLSNLSQAISAHQGEIVVGGVAPGNDPKVENDQPLDKKTRARNLLIKLGRGVGKGSAWLATTTAKPFMRASGFMSGLIEKEESNQDIVGLYQFFLNHSEEFDHLYEQAGTSEEMIELFLAKMDGIMKQKSLIIIKDFLVQAGVKKPIPDDFKNWELTPAEIAALDPKKLNVDFINKHKEYQEVKPLIGEMTQSELNDIITSGYFSKSITFENYKAALPKIYEGLSTIVGQIVGPKIALGIISDSLVSLYSTPVILADIGTSVSAAFCFQGQVKSKFKDDKELKSFCSYVTNRTSYELMKSRAKGFVSGKNLRAKIDKKLQERRERKALEKKPETKPEQDKASVSNDPA